MVYLDLPNAVTSISIQGNFCLCFFERKFQLKCKLAKIETYSGRAPV